MNNRPPDFYLSSREGHITGEPRMCFQIRRVRYGDRDDCLLVNIYPSLNGKSYGLHGEQIDRVVLATRFRGDSLFPPNRWPLDVYVLRILIKKSDERESFGNEELANIAWAELYRDREEIPPPSIYTFGS